MRNVVSHNSNNLFQRRRERFLDWCAEHQIVSYLTDYRFYVCLLITGAIIAISATVFQNSYVRLGESLSDFGNSFMYLFGNLFDMDAGEPTVNNYVVDGSILLPADFSVFVEKFHIWCNEFVSRGNFKNYVVSLYTVFYFLIMAVMILPPVFIVIAIAVNVIVGNQINNDYGEDTAPLKIFKAISRFFAPVKREVLCTYRYIKEARRFQILWFIAALLSLNVATIVVSFFAYYYYFVSSFEVSSIWIQVYKLVVDLQAMTYVPWWVWGVVVVCILNVIRKKIAYKRLWAREYCNRNFIRTLPINTLITASMGAGKGRFMTDASLSIEVMFRDKALELLRDCDFMFPNFSWMKFELYLRDYINRGIVYNLASCESCVKRLGLMFDFFRDKDIDLDSENVGISRAVIEAKDCFGYDYDKYGLTYDDGLQVHYLFDVLVDYAKLYFIYIQENSLIVSNYSIRSDADLLSYGNFPTHIRDFFSSESYDPKRGNFYSRIIDYDMLRLGRKMSSGNRNVLEFGIFALTELDKERGNMLDTIELRKLADECNQKNDMFNASIKMSRHPAVVMNYPFVRFMSDSQRDMSVNSDLKELGSIVEIGDTGDVKLLMPLFFIEEFIYQTVYQRFLKRYSEYRFERGDNTLFMHMYKSLAMRIKHHYDRYYNTFGSAQETITVRKASETEVKKTKYFIQPKKIYSGRYATDSLAGFFKAKARRADIGLVGMPTYKGLTADIDELDAQHSFFVRDITKY